MCLDTITKSKQKWGYGYKIVNPGIPEGQAFVHGITAISRRVPAKLGKVVEIREESTISFYKNNIYHPYPTGFHIFASLESLFRWRTANGWVHYPVVRVRWSKPVAFGKQSGYEVIVARRVTILEEVR